MKRVHFAFVLCFAFSIVVLLPSSVAQQPSASGSTLIVPHVIRFAGVLKDFSGHALTGVVGITFSLYRDQEGGATLWIETQNASLDANGRYDVLLGAQHAEGVPMELFTSGEARWLGIHVQGQSTEQPRVLLVSVPYALKAADAETVGGLPPSAFVRAAVPATTADTTINASTGMAAPAVLAVTGSGTLNFLPMWTGTTPSTTIGNSALFQTGSGPTAKIGINTTTPNATLDVHGATTVRGFLSLPSAGTATATQGFSSNAEQMTASAYNSTTKAAVSQTFSWQAEPVGNNTGSPSGKSNLLFASGTGSPAETGLSISSKGAITLTANLTAKQLVSNVATGTAPLVVSSTTQVSNLNASQLGGLAASAFAHVAGSNTFSGNQSVTGNLSATQQLISTVATGTAPLNVNSTTEVRKLNANFLGGNPASAFAFIGASNTFVPNQLFEGNGINMILGDPGCGPGFAAIGFGALSACNNYSITGDGTHTFLNRPSGGEMLFREGNNDQMIIASGGVITTNTTTDSGTGLTVTSSAGQAGQFNGGTDSFGFGHGGLEADGGNDTGASVAGDGVVAFGGNSSAATGVPGNGIYAGGGTGPAGSSGYAGFFGGDVHISGNLSKSGGSFKIDHPLDPANKYLYHSFVESPDMKNIYDGVVTMDANGEAVVELPDWFGVLNRDFRYQLTCIGGFAPVYIAQKVQNNSFKIAGGQPGMEVSWQVTGIRKDAWANAHRIPVEEEKNARERGHYLHPELYGAPEERGIEWARHPELMKHLKERRALAPKPVTPPK